MLKNRLVSGLLLLVFLAVMCFRFFAQSHHQVKQSAHPFTSSSNTASSQNSHDAPSAIPQKVYDVLAYVRKYHRAPDGFEGGREFKNREHQLAGQTPGGNTIHYQEWDVNRKEQGHNRGVERLVTGDDNRAWYSNDHYKSFNEVK